MSAFEIVHHDDVQGKLVCYDRLIFKGHLTTLYHPGGMAAFLESQGVKLVGWKALRAKDDRNCGRPCPGAGCGGRATV